MRMKLITLLAAIVCIGACNRRLRAENVSLTEKQKRFCYICGKEEALSFKDNFDDRTEGGWGKYNLKEGHIDANLKTGVQGKGNYRVNNATNSYSNTPLNEEVQESPSISVCSKKLEPFSTLKEGRTNRRKRDTKSGKGKKTERKKAIPSKDYDTTDEDNEDEEDEELERRRKRRRKKKRRRKRRHWGKWSEWSPCSVTCGKGRKIRWRKCIAKVCPTGELEMGEKTCQLPACSLLDKLFSFF